MAEELARALQMIDSELLGQNLKPERAASLAAEVGALNGRVRSFARANLEFYDDPSSFLAMLRQTAWTPPSPGDR